MIEHSRIVIAELKHVDQIVTCHMAAFPDMFLTLLGHRVLRAFYRFCIRYHNGICLVCIDNDEHVVGIVAGGAPELRPRFIRRHFLLLALTICRNIFVHHFVRERFLQHIEMKLTYFKKRLFGATYQNNKIEPVLPSGTWSNLLSIGVHPFARGKGVGSALIERFCAECEQKGFSIVRLSVRNDNIGAIAFYRRTGWEPVLAISQGTFLTRSLKGAK